MRFLTYFARFTLEEERRKIHMSSDCIEVSPIEVSAFLTLQLTKTLLWFRMRCILRHSDPILNATNAENDAIVHIQSSGSSQKQAMVPNRPWSQNDHGHKRCPTGRKNAVETSESTVSRACNSHGDSPGELKNTITCSGMSCHSVGAWILFPMSLSSTET